MRHREILIKHSRYLAWGIVLIIVVLTAMIRVRLLAAPLERDEGEYAYAGQLILQGIPPYAQAYNMKMPGIYAIYALIMAIFGQTHAGIHLGLLFVNIATIILIFILGRRLFDTFIGVAAAAYFAILSLNPVVQGIFANAEHFVILPMLAGVLLLVQGIESGRLRDLFWSGLFLGLAFVIKQHAAVMMVFAILYVFFNLFIRRTFDRSKRLLKCGLLLSGMVIPYAITVLIMLLTGVFDRFWFWTVTYAHKYVTMTKFNFDLLKMRLTNEFSMATLIWICAILGLLAPLWDKKARSRSLFIATFFIFSFLSVCPGFYFRPHYFIFLLPALSLSAGIGISSTRRFFPKSSPAVLKKGIPALLAVIVLLYSVYQLRVFLFKMDPITATRLIYSSEPFPESLKIAEYIKKHTKKGDRIAVLGSEPQIYFYSDRHSATGYIYTYALMEKHDFALDMQKEMIREIESASPDFLVFVKHPHSWSRRHHSNPLIFNWFEQYVENNYKRVGIVYILWPRPPLYCWDEEFSELSPVSDHWISIHERKGRGIERSPTESRVEKSRVLNRMGKMQGKSGNLDTAISLFEESVQLDPNYAESYNDLGYAYYLKGDHERAEEYFKKAIEVDPGHGIARRNLETLRSTGDQSPKADEI